ncbi:hypothetical protein BDZ45DRAFT_229430 [Acephala macrosclerotiorum]|nr:hypothetical protein BDZ45DRAFT_229430 [Acephala macrosclerotiorum]
MPYRPGRGIDNRWLNIKCIPTWVQPSNRLRILYLVLKYHGTEPVDLTLDEDLRALGKVQAHILRVISVDEALHLLQRIRGSQSKPTRGDLANFLGETKDLDAKDPKTYLEKYKRLATIESGKNQRASFAETALQCSIATGSIEIYGNTELGSQAFHERLPHCQKNILKLYPQILRLYCSAVSLSEAPDEIHKFGRAAIAAKIREANKVILELVETACLALKEPSFFAQDRTATVTLISDIVKPRCIQVEQPQQELELSSDDVYEVMWKDTLALASQLERMSV